MKRSLSGLLLAIVLAGCPGAPERQDPLEAPAPPPEMPEAMRDTETCINPEGGYRVAYPADWHTNPGDVLPPCSLFDPRPIRVAPATEIPVDIAISMGREPAGFEEVAGATHGERNLSREEMVWLDRRAARIESISTGEGLYEAGLRSYRVVVDLDGEVFVASTHEAGDLPYEEKRRILDVMLRTLELREP
jgi:hypothetical protein